MRRLTLICGLLLAAMCAYTQGGLVLNNGAFVTIDNGAKVVIDNGNPASITELGPAGGRIVSEAEGDAVIWNIGTGTGVYHVPFVTTPTLLGGNQAPVPVTLNITAAGTGSGSIAFATYETTTDLNTPYATGVTSMNDAGGNDNTLYVADRFYFTEATGYTARPAVNMTLGFDDANNEIGGTNTITEANLVAQTWNSTLGGWEGTYGTANVVQDEVAGIILSPTQFRDIWVLTDIISPIPIEFQHISADCDGQRVALNWTVSNEVGNDYYLIERSIDNAPWEVVAQVQAGAGSAQAHTYNWTDQGAFGGAVFYRLHQVDLDGQSTLVATEKVQCGLLGEFDCSVYPNPNNGNFMIQLDGEKGGDAELMLADVTGKFVLHRHVAEGTAAIGMDLSQQAAGFYFLKVATANGTCIEKISVNH